MLFKREVLSEKFNLEKILVDIENIAYANPNAALSQLRTYIEVYCNATLTYEGIEVNDDLNGKINKIKTLSLLNNEEIELLHQIRKTGNAAVHGYYSSREEVLVYLQVCKAIYLKFINEYEKEKIVYKKKIMKKYINNISKDYYELRDNENEYSGELILENSIVIPNEDLNLNSLYEYDLLKNRLISYFDIIDRIIEELHLYNNRVSDAKEKLNNNNFNLIVLGEFNRGKSTFLNALLGECLLPSDILPTTATITRINYDNNKRCEVIYEDGEKEIIDINMITEYITNSNLEFNKKIDTIDIYYPLELCKHGCIIIDTPGVNDLNEQSVIITENYIPEADAVIFIIDCNQAFTESEKVFIKTKVLKNDIRKIFFIVNKVDSINSEGIDSFKAYVENSIIELNIECKIYYLSSKRSLICKIKDTKDEYLEEFDIFTKELEYFLVRDKGRYLLINSCRRISEFIDDISSNIYKMENDIKNSIAVLEKKSEEFKNIEKDIQNNKVKIFNQTDIEYMDIKNEMKSIISKELNLSFNKIINSMDLSEKDNPLNYSDLELKINEDINKWLNNRIVPFVMMRLNNINDSLYKVLIESVKCIDDFEGNGKLPKVKQLKIVQSTKFEIPTCYNKTTNNKRRENEIMFMGAGSVLTMLITGTLLSGIGGAMLGILFSSVLGNESNVKSEIDINSKIIKEKDKLIKEIIMKVNNIIDKNYDTNCRYVNNYIDNALKSNSIRLNTILDKKRGKDIDFKVIKPQFNNYLNKIFIIKKKVNLLSNLLEEIKYD